MKVLLSWLREFAPIEGDPAALGDHLSDLGTPVEDMSVIAAADGIVVGRVLETRPHPDADRIHLVDVDGGDGEPVQVCCGAFNMQAGDLVPFATVGSALPDGLEITRREMRGEWSNGMLCSAVELQLGSDAEGILILGDDLELGAPVFEALGLAGEIVYDLEVNPNRPDALSMAGVARDLAARLGVPFGIPDWPLNEIDEAVGDAASVEIIDTDLCGRFVARVLRNVSVGTSPAWMGARLTLAGMRPINSVVDVSNYVMLELGAPNHTYDLNLVSGGGLRVRRAVGGERIETLDGVERTMHAGDGLICDGDDEPIGIAGVMGGASTEISAATTDVLVEAAWWDPMSIAVTAGRLGLRSEASTRFERGVDHSILDRAAQRFCDLLAPGVDIVAGYIDERGDHPKPKAVEVRTKRVNSILGTRFKTQQIADYLEPIGFACEADTNGTQLVTIPSWRLDSTAEIDVIEEVGRHHGYERIRKTVPRPATPGSLTVYQAERRVVRDVMVGLGLAEVMPNPFLAPDDVQKAGLDGSAPIGLVNPLVAAESVLRPSLLPGLVKVLAYNSSHRNAGVGLFEAGAVFMPPIGDDELPDEQERLAVAWAGHDAGRAKHVWDVLVDALDVQRTEIVSTDDLPGMHPTRGARLLAGGDDVGVVGEVDPSVLEAFEVNERVAWLDVRLDGPSGLLGVDHGAHAYRPVSRFPSSDIDLDFVVDDETPAARVEDAIAVAGGDLVVSTLLTDVFRAEAIGDGKRSLTYSLRLQAPDRTLTDEEVAAVRQACIDAVESTLPAILRGV